MKNNDLLEKLYRSINRKPHALRDRPDIARVEIHHDRVLGVHLVPGLEITAEEKKDTINAKIRVVQGTIIENPIQVCFGMIPENGLQRIVLEIDIEDDVHAAIVAHCTFPNALNIRHEMDAIIRVGKNAHYAYFERHVHGDKGGVTIVPNSKVFVDEGGKYQTDFELIKGRVGKIYLDVDAELQARATAAINARLSASGDDIVEITEKIRLVGEDSVGALTSYLAVRDTAQACINNEMIATAAGARGHVDCKEIIQDNGIARAVPIVSVEHHKAHVTHEAAIGSVDNKQLETLMSRGLDEDTAVDLIIQGMLGGAPEISKAGEDFLTL